MKDLEMIMEFIKVAEKFEEIDPLIRPHGEKCVLDFIYEADPMVALPTFCTIIHYYSDVHGLDYAEVIKDMAKAMLQVKKEELEKGLNFK